VWCVSACSPLCSHCAKLVRQQVYKCSADTASKTCSNSVVCRKFCTVHWLSTSHRSSTLPSMQINCYSTLPFKVRTSPYPVMPHSRQFSIARVAGSVFGRLFKLRYLLLAGAVGGGIAAHEVINFKLMVIDHVIEYKRFCILCITWHHKSENKTFSGHLYCNFISRVYYKNSYWFFLSEICSGLLKVFTLLHYINFAIISSLYSYVFTRESSYCFQRILAIAILSVCLFVCPSVCHTGRSVKNGAS